MRVQISQNNYIAGDLDFNFEIVKSEYLKACDKDCDLVVFPELAIAGYPVGDFLFKDYFILDVQSKIDQLIKLTIDKNCAILIGTPILKDELLYNAALLLQNGEVKKEFLKKELPNYKLFDEKRYFVSSNELSYVDFNDKRISVLICEDAWHESSIDQVKDHDSDLLIVINASPYSPDKLEQRLEVCKKFCLGVRAPLIYVNKVGGVDSFLFDGKSFVMNRQGELVKRLGGFVEESEVIYFDNKLELLFNEEGYSNDLSADLYNGALLALRDYVRKTGFEKVVIGMSGGIDSAFVANLAVDALGSQNVRLIALPSRFSSSASFDDANQCAKNLDIELEVISIEDVFRSSLETINPHFKGKKIDATEENLQSRIRGLLLMAMSNKFGELLITTGNKSEMAVGYATIYGDMNGAFNPIKDLYKTQIFELAKWRNKNVPDLSIYRKKNLIPNAIIDKEPSAELAFDQKDSDSLPDYKVLDKILHKMIEEEKSVGKIIDETGFDEDLVKKIAKLFYQNEYKRQQAVLGPKLSKMSFDRDRRYLITSRYAK